MYMCVYMCICLLMFMCVCRCMCPRGQKKAWDPLDLKLRVVVNCPVWVWELKAPSLQEQWS